MQITCFVSEAASVCAFAFGAAEVEAVPRPEVRT